MTPVSSPRRRRIRQTNIGTTPIPYETLTEVAARWRAELKEQTDAR